MMAFMRGEKISLCAILHSTPLDYPLPFQTRPFHIAAIFRWLYKIKELHGLVPMNKTAPGNKTVF